MTMSTVAVPLAVAAKTQGRGVQVVLDEINALHQQILTLCVGSGGSARWLLWCAADAADRAAVQLQSPAIGTALERRGRGVLSRTLQRRLL